MTGNRFDSRSRSGRARARAEGHPQAPPDQGGERTHAPVFPPLDQGEVDEPSSPPVCSIVIPTYNARELLDRCLASIERYRPIDPEWPIEVVVVDDASSDGTADWLVQ